MLINNHTTESDGENGSQFSPDTAEGTKPEDVSIPRSTGLETGSPEVAGNRNPEQEDNPKEFVLIIMKPMAVEGNLQDHIMERLVQEGRVKITASKVGVQSTRETIEAHYSQTRFDSEGNPTPQFPPLVQYLAQKRIDVFILEESEEAIGDARPLAERLRRDLIGPSDPMKAEPHHIRHLARELPYLKETGLPSAEAVAGKTTIMDNLIHCSDSLESAASEVALWFGDTPDLVDKYNAFFASLTADENASEAA